MNEKKSRVERFVKFLYNLSGPSGKADLAELRRAAADPLGDFRSIRILGPYLPDDSEAEFNAYRLVATLYAIHKQRFSDTKVPSFASDEKRSSFGTSLRRLRQQLGNGQGSLDLRFSALLDTAAEDLAVPLRGLVQRCASAEKPVPIDYAQLLTDITWWTGNHTRPKWARHYWQTVDVDQVSIELDDEEVSNDESL